ncbi:MAG: TonB-dependent receptor [Xanthomonadaceae bacterium]|nr:TonB-dependent receptor [Xanthomonadaceae bacterium]
MKQLEATPRRKLLATALLLALSQTVAAQSATQDEAANPDAPAQSTRDSDANELDVIEVRGIRGSLTSAMNVKRNGQGVVDGISSEEIGKFPDTNLAESLQRISGVSIDRSALGEGSRVTVRGVGPDFNLVLLNGRQMPASSLLDTDASSSRAFDFANLASEAISGIEVYKSSRASTPTGGIGATINVKTARPLNNPGLHANVGIKTVYDESNGNLPNALQGDDLTPEISGIFSNTFADGKFGVALTASYQERDLGYNQVSVGNGWRTFRGDENNWGTIPQPGTPGSERITNRPGPNDIYSVPQNLNYSVNGVQRQRTNGQLTLQWAPTDRLTATLDYTYSENRIQTQRNELSVWFNFGPSSSSWTNGPIAAPNVYSEIIVPANSDLAMGGAKYATRNENQSIGLNLEWAVSDSVNLELDMHRSSAESGADSPYGSNSVLGAAGLFRGTTTVDFSRPFPILTVALPPGQTDIDAAQMQVTGSSFRNSYMRAEVDQLQLSGDWAFGEASQLDFGVASTEVRNRSAFSVVQNDTWGGNVTPNGFLAYPDSLWRRDSMRNYFQSFGNSRDPRWSSAFFTFDFEAMRQAAIAATGRPDLYRRSDVFSTDRRTTEKSQSAYLQYSTTFDWKMPLQVAAGVRYERTEVTSTALVPNFASGIQWRSANELNLVEQGNAYSTLKGDYRYLLPNLDLRLDISDNLILRGSYGETIGRPGWADIQGGKTYNQLVRVDGGTGSFGNPDLEPLLSHNFDLSLEWYYGESSYLSVGYFRKNIDNYIGTTQIADTSSGLRTPVGGAYWNQAIGAGGCATTDMVCIRNYIFANFNGQPGVDSARGIITGQPGDPVASFRVTTPANKRSAALDGWELNVQHMFGGSGFGMSANYTIVDSGLMYDNYRIGEQFALIGLSDSANIVAFFERGPWQLRGAYNWRDKFLAGVFDGAGANPVYVESYGQFDFNVGYRWNDQWSISFETINALGKSQRSHSRHVNQLEYLTQTGPRYMLGMRYNFR